MKGRVKELKDQLGQPSLPTTAIIDRYLEQMLRGYQAIAEDCIPLARPSEKAKLF